MRKLFPNKKAQITIFIIVGIILLFSSALIFYIKGKVTGVTPDPVIIQKNLPEDLEGLKKYVEECVYTTGKQAVIIAGSQGGYIYPNDFGVVGNPFDPTESTGINPFTNVKNFVVPYWYYLESPNNCNGNCVFSSKRPALIGEDSSTIQSQISRYVEENLDYCINNFEIYKNMGYDVKPSASLKIDTYITSRSVKIDVYWPMLAGQDNLKQLDHFIVDIPVALKQIYDSADKLMQLEQNKSMTGAYTLNTILAYAADKLPSAGTLSSADIFTGNPPIKWSFKKSRSIVEDNIQWYTQAIKVMNSKNYAPYNNYDANPIIQAAKFKMVIATNTTDFSHYEINFKYSKSWPLYFDITPREGDNIQGKSSDFGVLALMRMAIKDYAFQYDISYPVVVTLYDETAFYGEGYDFNFAYETNIRNNKVLKSGFYALSVDNLKNSFACDESQKKSGNITVNVTNKFTGKPIPDAGVYVYFGKSGCPIGETNEDGLSVERYPKGIGELVVKKQDYTSSRALFATKENTTDSYNFSIYPIDGKDVKIKKIVMNKFSNTTINNMTVITCYHQWRLDNRTPKDIGVNETFSFIIKKVQTVSEPDDLNGGVTYTYLDSDLTQTIRLVPGLYEFDVIATLDKNVTIPAQSKTYGRKKDKITIDFEEQSQNPYLEGHLKFSSSTFYFEVKPEELYNNDYIEVYALVYDLESLPMNCRNADPNDFMPTPNADTILLNNKQLLIPKFKSYIGGSS